MGDFQHKDMTGSMFVNDYKDTDKKPDWKGKVMIAGHLYDIAAWKRQGNRGEWLSLSITEPKQKPGQPQQPTQRPAYRSPARPTAAQRVLGNEYQGEPELPSSAGTSTPENEIPFAPNWI